MAKDKENMNRYRQARKEYYARLSEREGVEYKGSREMASEDLDWISPERLERIENEKSLPQPQEVVQMAKVYETPSLCNYYCSKQCPIGQEYVPEIRVKELSQIVLEMLASLNSAVKMKDRLIEITADGEISKDEIADFIDIQEQLEKLSITVETLQIWSERMVARGKIDEEEYNAQKESRKQNIVK